MHDWYDSRSRGSQIGWLLLVMEWTVYVTGLFHESQSQSQHSRAQDVSTARAIVSNSVPLHGQDKITLATDVTTENSIGMINLYTSEFNTVFIGNEKFDILLLHTFPHKGQLFGRACSILPWSSRKSIVCYHFSQLSPRKMSRTNFLPSNSSFPANYSKSGTCTMKIKFLLGKV